MHPTHPTPAWPTPLQPTLPHPCMAHPTPAWPTLPCMTNLTLHDPPHPFMTHPTPAWPTTPLHDPPHPCMTHPTLLGPLSGRQVALWLFHFKIRLIVGLWKKIDYSSYIATVWCIDSGVCSICMFGKCCLLDSHAHHNSPDHFNPMTSLHSDSSHTNSIGSKQWTKWRGKR